MSDDPERGALSVHAEEHDWVAEVIRNYPTAKVILEAVTETAEGAETVVDDLEQRLKDRGIQVERSDIIEVFRKLTELGVGRFIVGRRSHPSRFRWEEARVLRSVTKNDDRSARDAALADANSRNGSLETIEHSYQLRPGYEVRLSLPRDLSDNEARRLAGFIETLPFD